MHPEGMLEADKWGAVGFLANPSARQRGWRVGLRVEVGMLRAWRHLGGHSAALLTLSSCCGGERTPGVPALKLEGARPLSLGSGVSCLHAVYMI